MPFKMELSLEHNGKKWVAQNQQIHIEAEELTDLDIQVKEAVIQQNLYPKGSKVTVYMNFNQAVIPEWIRQYANHYFNRKITFTI